MLRIEITKPVPDYYSMDSNEQIMSSVLKLFLIRANQHSAKLSCWLGLSLVQGLPNGK